MNKVTQTAALALALTLAVVGEAYAYAAISTQDWVGATVFVINKAKVAYGSSYTISTTDSTNAFQTFLFFPSNRKYEINCTLSIVNGGNGPQQNANCAWARTVGSTNEEWGTYNCTSGVCLQTIGSLP